MEIVLKDKTIQGITVDGSIDGSVEPGDVFQFFCAVLAHVEVQGKAHIVIDNDRKDVNVTNTTKDPRVFDLLLVKRSTASKLFRTAKALIKIINDTTDPQRIFSQAEDLKKVIADIEGSEVDG